MNDTSATDPRPLLDATCSAKRAWPKVADVRLDVRASAHPDVVASTTALPFPDGSFQTVYCDPPFNIYRSGTKRDLAIRAREGEDYGRFGHWESRAAWLAWLGPTAREFYRVLDQGGQVYFTVSHGWRETGLTKGKLTGASVPYTDVIWELCAARFVLREDEVVNARGPFAGLKGSPPRVHYLRFLKVEL